LKERAAAAAQILIFPRGFTQIDIFIPSICRARREIFLVRAAICEAKRLYLIISVNLLAAKGIEM